MGVEPKGQHGHAAHRCSETPATNAPAGTGGAGCSASRHRAVPPCGVLAPSHAAPPFGARLSGGRIDIFCKRDDLTGPAFGGNKTRKLDFLIADAVALGADTLVAVGATQSNFCRLAAAAGSTCGLEVHLVLGAVEGPRAAEETGDADAGPPRGNLLLDHLLGATVHPVPSPDWTIWERRGLTLMEDLERQGRRPYWLPIGGSVPLGALGYAAAFVEIMQDCHRLGIEPQAIVHASSSGGTQAGLLVGKALCGWSGDILGMGVAKNAADLSREVLNLAQETGRLLNVELGPADVLVDDAYQGQAYGLPTEAGEEAISLFARREGIFLDRVYSGKAAAGLLDYGRRRRFGSASPVIFLHTGGNVELFA